MKPLFSLGKKKNAISTDRNKEPAANPDAKRILCATIAAETAN